MSDQNKNRRSFIKGSVARGLMAANTAALAGLINTPGSLAATETTQPGSTQPGSTQPGSTQPGSTQPGTTQPQTTAPQHLVPDYTTITYHFPTQQTPNVLGKGDTPQAAMEDLQTQIWQTITGQYPGVPYASAVIDKHDKYITTEHFTGCDVYMTTQPPTLLVVTPVYDAAMHKFKAVLTLPQTNYLVVITLVYNYSN